MSPGLSTTLRRWGKDSCDPTLSSFRPKPMPINTIDVSWLIRDRYLVNSIRGMCSDSSSAARNSVFRVGARRQGGSFSAQFTRCNVWIAGKTIFANIGKPLLVSNSKVTCMLLSSEKTIDDSAERDLPLKFVLSDSSHQIPQTRRRSWETTPARTEADL